MKLYNLGTVPWKQSQLIYHALGMRGEEAVVISSPKEPYTCVGFHQDVSFELDLEFCKKNDIGIFRREIGGGTVYLDNDQIFYNIIVAKEKSPLDQRVFFRRFLEPVLGTYHALGIDAEFVPICDLVVNGKKISGNGGGDIGPCKVATGSILLDFDFKTMSHILNVSSEEFRHELYTAMKANMTTVRAELGHVPDRKKLESILVSKCKDMFGDLEDGTLDKTLVDEMNELDTRFSSPEWLYKKRKAPGYRTVKIIEGKNLTFYSMEDLGLLIETSNLEQEISGVKVYGSKDQELEAKLKQMLIGKKFDDALVTSSAAEVKSK